jgi:hypothetical protein
VIIVLNGPLGIGKSILAEALTERIAGCVMLDGDHLVAANPPLEGIEHLHSALELMVGHYRRLGYRYFVINHLWTVPAELEDLRERLADEDETFRCFLLTLPAEENLRRIERRSAVRAVDELEFELRTVAAEREALSASPPGTLGEPLDVSGPVSELVERVLDLVVFPESGR